MSMTAGGAAPTAGAEVRLPFPLQEDEQVIQVYRKHWLFLWPRTAWYAVLALAPALILAVVLSRTAGLGGNAGKVFWIAALIWVAYWALRALLNWYRYHNDIWVVTNQRIVDSTKTSPFSLKVSTADLVNVQDMTVERDGLLRTMFNFGDIICQTAADIQEFRLAGIPRPAEVQLLVDKERDRERTRARG